MSSLPGSTGKPRGSGFAGRLLVAESLVLAAGGTTTWLVATGVGPGIFHEHLRRAGVTATARETSHVEQAFASALLISIGVALVASVVAALAVTWYLSRRVQRSIGSLTEAATAIAAGRAGRRVVDPGLGVEFAQLATTYNALAERLEATEATRRRMLADLAHEMRTPLATIEAHLEAVEDGVRELDAATLSVVRSSTHRLRRLAEDVASVSHAEEGSLVVTPAPVAAAAVANAAVEQSRARFEAKGVRLRQEVRSSATILVDADRMEQVLGNLLDNALRHTPPGGEVTVACRRLQQWVELTVSDTGEGIGPEHLEHVFDRFYRADTARDRGHGGSGIGLSIARAVVEAHGGGISVYSAGPGQGATFTMRLPLAPP